MGQWKVFGVQYVQCHYFSKKCVHQVICCDQKVNTLVFNTLIVLCFIDFVQGKIDSSHFFSDWWILDFAKKISFLLYLLCCRDTGAPVFIWAFSLWFILMPIVDYWQRGNASKPRPHMNLSNLSNFKMKVWAHVVTESGNIQAGVILMDSFHSVVQSTLYKVYIQINPSLYFSTATGGRLHHLWIF